MWSYTMNPLIYKIYVRFLNKISTFLEFREFLLFCEFWDKGSEKNFTPPLRLSMWHKSPLPSSFLNVFTKNRIMTLSPMSYYSWVIGSKILDCESFYFVLTQETSWHGDRGEIAKQLLPEFNIFFSLSETFWISSSAGHSLS